MIIQIDTREKDRAITRIQDTFTEKGIKFISSKMYVGDYQDLQDGSVVVDRKQNLSEICGNVCQEHERFKAELIRAQEAGIKVYILCEHGDNIKSIEDVKFWINPRLKKSPKALTGEKLYKIMKTQEERYGITYLFCNKEETGNKIIQILTNKEA